MQLYHIVKLDYRAVSPGLKDTSVSNYCEADDEALLKSVTEISHRLHGALSISMHERVPDGMTYSEYHLRQSFAKDTYDFHQQGLSCVHSSFGFKLERQPSSIDGAGVGVFVTAGAVPENHLVAMYPG